MWKIMMHHTGIWSQASKISIQVIYQLSYLVQAIESVWSTGLYIYGIKKNYGNYRYIVSLHNSFLWYGKELESPLVVATSCSVPFSFQSLSSMPPYIQAAPWLHHSRESFTTCGKVQLKSWNNSYHSIV